MGVWNSTFQSSSNCFTLCQFLLQDSSVPNVTYEEKQKSKFAFEQLKTKASQLNCWDRNELEELSIAR
jgi:hypothetical protein